MLHKIFAIFLIGIFVVGLAAFNGSEIIPTHLGSRVADFIFNGMNASSREVKTVMDETKDSLQISKSLDQVKTQQSGFLNHLIENVQNDYQALLSEAEEFASPGEHLNQIQSGVKNIPGYLSSLSQAGDLVNFRQFQTRNFDQRIFQEDLLPPRSGIENQKRQFEETLRLSANPIAERLDPASPPPRILPPQQMIENQQLQLEERIQISRNPAIERLDPAAPSPAMFPPRAMIENQNGQSLDTVQIRRNPTVERLEPASPPPVLLPPRPIMTNQQRRFEGMTQITVNPRTQITDQSNVFLNSQSDVGNFIERHQEIREQYQILLRDLSNMLESHQDATARQPEQLAEEIKFVQQRQEDLALSVKRHQNIQRQHEILMKDLVEIRLSNPNQDVLLTTAKDLKEQQKFFIRNKREELKELMERNRRLQDQQKDLLDGLADMARLERQRIRENSLIENRKIDLRNLSEQHRRSQAMLKDSFQRQKDIVKAGQELQARLREQRRTLHKPSYHSIFGFSFR